MGTTWVENNTWYSAQDFWYVDTNVAPDGKYVSPFYYNNNAVYAVGSVTHPTASTRPWTGTFENNTTQPYGAGPPAWEHQ